MTDKIDLTSDNKGMAMDLNELSSSAPYVRKTVPIFIIKTKAGWRKFDPLKSTKPVIKE